MKMTNLIKFSLVLCLVGLSASGALAYNNIGSAWRAFYPDTCQELQDATTNGQDCILCHTASLGFNDYGQAVKDANDDFGSIENDDSDGDGRTNGEEILIDCSLPGDAASPVDLDSWGSVKVLFR